MVSAEWLSDLLELTSGDEAVEIPDEAVDDDGVSDDDTCFDVPGLSCGGEVGGSDESGGSVDHDGLGVHDTRG